MLIGAIVALMIAIGATLWLGLGSFGISLLYIHCESNCTVGGVLFLPCFAEGLQCLKVLREFGSGDEDLLIVTL